MADNIELFIKIDENTYNNFIHNKYSRADVIAIHTALMNGTPLPKGHRRIVDISKIDEDRIDSNNPVISLIIGGECIEAVRLDYLNDLSTIIESDTESEEE